MLLVGATTAWLTCLVSASVRIDGAIGVRGRYNGGYAPPTPTQPGRPTMFGELLPFAAVQVESARSQGTLQYTPRIFMRYPNVLGTYRPLVLHGMSLAYNRAMTRRLNLNASGLGRVGEVDYIGARSIFGDAETAAPDLSRFRVASGDFGLGLTMAATRRQSVGATVFVGGNKPIGIDDTSTVRNTRFAQIFRTGATLTYALALSARDRAGVVGTGDYADFSTGQLWANYGGALFWNRVHSRRLTTNLLGGVLIANLLRAAKLPPALPGAVAQKPGTFPVPRASATLDWVVFQRSSVTVGIRLGGNVLAFFSPIRGTLEPRAGANAGLNLQIRRDLRAGADVVMFTAATSHPRIVGNSNGANVYATDETIITLRAPVMYRISDFASFDVGAMATLRAPHLRAPGFRVTQVIVYGYVGFSVAFGTGRGLRSFRTA